MVKYGEWEQLKKDLIYKKIVEWTPDKLVLEDGTVITIEMSESDCCASAGGQFSNVTLDAAITDIKLSEITSKYVYDDYTENRVTVTFIHNMNPIAQADVYADDGNGGYYYSVASLVIKDIHYQVVRA